MRFVLQGVEIGVEGSAAAEVARALSSLAEPSRCVRGADLVLAAERVADPAPAPAPATFVHEPLRGGRRGEALVLGDGRALFVIAPGGRRVDARLPADALADGGRSLAALHLPVLLAFALRHHGVYHLHAAALDEGGRAILVSGQAGVGKTTLALALLESGAGCLSDDAVFLAERESLPWVQGVPRPFHLRPATLDAFPDAAARAGPPDAEGRREIDPWTVWPRQVRSGRRRPGLLLFPEVRSGPATTVTPLAPADALGRLVEASALLVVDGAARSAEHLALLGRLAGEAPAFRVELGRDLLCAPAQVARRILAQAR
jgi:hypothetical protein